jgi:uncharacterized membrane protein YoaK (UPF0700 family)
MRVAVSPFYGLSFAAGCVDAISFVGFGGQHSFCGVV